MNAAQSVVATPTTSGGLPAPSSDSSERLLRRLAEIVGESYVHAEDSELDRRSQCTIPWNRRCAAVVYPGSVEEIRQVLLAAALSRIPVWPFAKGKNWGYGTTMARQPGAIILVLERLNRILEVNEELAYAVVEPGVTYRQLHEHLKANSIKLWCDCTDSSPDGSVLGNALDRGIGATSYHDHFSNVCGLEVLLPDGTVVRTGGGPPTLSHTWNTDKWGTGPSLEGLFSQSNFGIVTKMGVWLMPEPEEMNSFFLDLSEAESLPAVIDSVRRLALAGILTATRLFSETIGLALLIRYPRELLQGATCLSEEVLARLRQKYRIAPWSLGGALYGTGAQVRLARRILKRELSGYGKLRFVNDRRIRLLRKIERFGQRVQSSPHTAKAFDFLLLRLLGKPLALLEGAPHAHSVLQGAPTEYFLRYAYFKATRSRPDQDLDPVRDGCGLIWFAPILPLTGQHVSRVLSLARPLFHKHGFDFHVSLRMRNPRCLIAVMSIFFRKEDMDETHRAQLLQRELGRVISAAGYQQYRTSVADPEHLPGPSEGFDHLMRVLKTAFDPFQILAPGKSGIGGAKS